MSPHRADTHAARERLQRVLYMATGFGGIIFGLLLFGKIVDQFSELKAVFAWAALAAGVLVPAALTVLAWILPMRTLNGVAAATITCFILFELMWLPAMTVPFLADQKAPWMWGVNAIHAVLVTVLLRHRIAFVYSGLQAVIVGVVGHLATGNEWRLNLLDGVGAMIFCSIVSAASLALIQAADQQDLGAMRARAQASIEATKRSREREQGRINAIVHDDIMSVLLVASREEPSHRIAEQAEWALASIATLSVDQKDAPDYARADAITALRAAVTGNAAQVEFWHSSDGDALIPAEVVDALTEAISEAVRNSILHAGGPNDYVHRVVTVNLTDGGIRATIQDSGRGFNVRAVNDRRLGIRVSIHERMRLLDGGRATVESRPGRGTTVTLEWMRTS